MFVREGGGGRLFLATDIWKLMDEESPPTPRLSSPFLSSSPLLTSPPLHSSPPPKHRCLFTVRPYVLRKDCQWRHTEQTRARWIDNKNCSLIFLALVNLNNTHTDSGCCHFVSKNINLSPSVKAFFFLRSGSPLISTMFPSLIFFFFFFTVVSYSMNVMSHSQLHRKMRGRLQAATSRGNILLIYYVT